MPERLTDSSAVRARRSRARGSKASKEADNGNGTSASPQVDGLNSHNALLTAPSEGVSLGVKSPFELMFMRSNQDNPTSFAPLPLSRFVHEGGVSGVMAMLAELGGTPEMNERGDVVRFHYAGDEEHVPTTLTVDTLGSSPTVRLIEHRKHKGEKEKIITATMENPVVTRRIGPTGVPHFEFISRPVVEENLAGVKLGGESITAFRFEGGRVIMIDTSDPKEAHVVKIAKGLTPKVRVFADRTLGVSTTVYARDLNRDVKGTSTDLAQMLKNTPTHLASDVIRRGPEALARVDRDAANAKRLRTSARGQRTRTGNRVAALVAEGFDRPEKYGVVLAVAEQALQKSDVAARAVKIARQARAAREKDLVNTSAAKVAQAVKIAKVAQARMRQAERDAKRVGLNSPEQQRNAVKEVGKAMDAIHRAHKAELIYQRTQEVKGVIEAAMDRAAGVL